MPKINIVRTKKISAAVDKVFSVVSDMSQWSSWSPWLIMDPKASVDVRFDNKYYSWQGSRVGSGNMEIVSQVDNKSVDYNLVFLKPWKSTAKVKIETIAQGDETEVRWHMDSSLPFFMFWMKKQMTAFISSDYDRGLNLLKDYVEDGKIHSQLNFIGEEHYPGSNYIGIKRATDIDVMPDKMKKDFTKLMSRAHAEDNLQPEQAFCIYHKWDMVKQTMEYTAGVPYTSEPVQSEGELFKGSIPATKVYTLEHVGPYEHLGNAWSALYMMQRNKEFKAVKNIHPFETYLNSPMDTDPKDLRTRIHFAIK